MFKKVLRNSTLIIFSFFITFYFIFSRISPAQSAQISSVPNEDDSMGIVLEESNDGLERAKTSVASDFGDDQAFPFIPGFGKNSGKD